MYYPTGVWAGACGSVAWSLLCTRCHRGIFSYKLLLWLLSWSVSVTVFHGHVIFSTTILFMLSTMCTLERRPSFLESLKLLAPYPSSPLRLSTTPTPNLSLSCLSPSRLITSKTLSPIHDLINVFLFTIMLTQMCHTPSIFSVFSQPGDLIFFKFVCSCSSCSWYLASPSWCDRQQDPFENAGWIIVISVEMYLFET